MRILHIALTDGGGAGRGMINLHYALLAQGIESRVLVAERQTEAPYVQVAKPNQYIWSAARPLLLAQRVARRLGICLTDYDRLLRRIYCLRRACPVPFSSPVTQYDLSSHPEVLMADVVHLHYVAGFVDVPSFFTGVQKPVVWTLRDENPGLGGFHYRATKAEFYNRYAPLEDRFLHLKQLAIGGCQRLALVSLSEAMRAFCQDVDFLCNKPNQTIYNAISPADYSLLSREEARQALGLKPADTIVSFVCTSLAEARKGFREARQAVRLLARRDVKLLCVGNAEGLEADSDVLYLGRVTDVSRISQVYSASDVFLSPSSAESFGKTVVEALYCGTPVVSTPVGIAPEVVDDTTGCLVSEVHPELISEALRRVLNTRYDRQTLRQKAISMCSPAEVARRHIVWYSSLLTQ